VFVEGARVRLTRRSAANATQRRGMGTHKYTFDSLTVNHGDEDAGRNKAHVRIR
jgi:hypothetical protein